MATSVPISTKMVLESKVDVGGGKLVKKSFTFGYIKPNINEIQFMALALGLGNLRNIPTLNTYKSVETEIY